MKKLFWSLIMITLSACSMTPKELPVVADAGVKELEPNMERKEVLLTEEYVLKVLGNPNVRRKESPSEVLVYPQNGCVLFIYVDKTEGKIPLVKHMEIGMPAYDSVVNDSYECLKVAGKLR